FVYAAYDLAQLTHAGAGITGYPDIHVLAERNPDTVAWLQLEGTHVRHPVVQGRDNYEYLNLDLDRNDYAGGCLFLDTGCRADFSGEYFLIHGHHMAYGAMFGDLEKYLEPSFLGEHHSGVLLTETGTWILEIAGAGIADAYDPEVYSVSGRTGTRRELTAKCSCRNTTDFQPGDRMLVLSTCAGDMSDHRIIVLCRMRSADPET
ncbi:MAG: class B sortase, partial [Mogibacterium sp.]|nr:class B sortase [Mogibacterium sp.]